MELRNSLVDMNNTLQLKGKEVEKVADELVRFYKIRSNLDAAKNELLKVSKLINLIKIARQHVDRNAFFDALQIVDVLRSVLHNNTMSNLRVTYDDDKLDSKLADSANSQFMTALRRYIPDIVSTIKQRVSKRVTDWFVHSREAAGIIGAKALDAANIQQLEDKKVQKSSKPKPRASRLRSRSSSDNNITWESELPSDTFDATLRILKEELDSTPLEEFIGIFEYIGERHAAVSFYTSNRIPQLSIQTMVQVDVNRLKPGQFVNCCRELFEKLIGYFVVERSLSVKMNLIPMQELNELWDTTLDQVIPLVIRELNSTDDPNQAMDLFELVLLSSLVLGSKGQYRRYAGGDFLLNTTRLKDVCISEKGRIPLWVEANAKSLLRGFYNTDNLITCTLKNAEDPRLAIVNQFGFLELDEGVNVEYPIECTFSESILDMLGILMQAIRDMFRFAKVLSDDDPKSDTSSVVAAKLAASVANLLILDINQYIEEKIRDSGISPNTLCQYAVNAWFLFKGAGVIEEHIQSLATNDQSDFWKLENAASLDATHELAQSCLLESISSRIDELLSSSGSIDWTPQQLPNEPHWFVTDIVQYLQFQFGMDSSLRMLPRSKHHAIQVLVCRHISDGIVDLLCGPKIRNINPASVYALWLDMQELLKFANSSEVEDLKHCFDQFSQLVKLLHKPDLDAYLNPDARNKTYYYVSKDQLRSILSKYKQLGIGSRMFSSSSEKVTVIKQSEIDRVLQNLR